MEKKMPNRLKTRGPNKHSASTIAVIGLGRFGTSLALELVKGGREVLGIDSDEKLVQNISDKLTHVIQADSTDEAALRELGIPDFDSAVVAIGSDLEASILTASLVLQLGVPQV
jgi:trk system potassium uptake protein TrkA